MGTWGSLNLRVCFDGSRPEFMACLVPAPSLFGGSMDGSLASPRSVDRDGDRVLSRGIHSMIRRTIGSGAAAAQVVETTARLVWWMDLYRNGRFAYSCRCPGACRGRGVYLQLFVCRVHDGGDGMSCQDVWVDYVRCVQFLCQ